MLSWRFLSVLVLLLPIAAHSRCDIDCGPFGHCVVDTRDCDGDICVEHDCLCDDGWSGADCSIQYEQCEVPITEANNGATVCFNGGKCESFSAGNNNNTQGMRCNCQATASDSNIFAGHQCTFPARDVCEKDRAYSSYAYCVNGGMCRKYVPPGARHPFCTCTNEWEGRHCQFKKGTAPIKELMYVDSGGYKYSSTTEEDVYQLSKQETLVLIGLSLFSVALCILGCTCICSRLCGCFFFRRQDIVLDHNEGEKHQEFTEKHDLDLTSSSHEEENENFVL